MIRSARLGARGTTRFKTRGSFVFSMATGKSLVKNGLSSKSLRKISQLKFPKVAVIFRIELIPIAWGYFGSIVTSTVQSRRSSLRRAPPSTAGAGGINSCASIMVAVTSTELLSGLE